MCLNPRIILNPRFVQYTALNERTLISTPDADFTYHRSFLQPFDYKNLSPYCQHVTEANIDAFNYVDTKTGDCMPMYIVTDCGKCEVCITRKRTSIKHRMILEQYANKDSNPIFLTLTYNNDYLPVDGVSVRDVQLFLKRFRRYVEYHYENFPKFRYVFFSEYGKLYQRPHYHAIIFGVPLDPRDILKFNEDIAKEWQKGYVYAKICDHGCFNYVSKYVSKGSNVPLGKNPNFRLSSRKNGGIGVPAFDDPILLYQAIQNPHPIVKINVLGKVFDVYIPKSIRDRLFQSPTMIVPEHIKKTYKHFIFINGLLHALASEYDDFANYLDSFGSKFCHILNRDHSFIIPREIFDKFAFLKYGCDKIFVPSEWQNKKILDSYKKQKLVKTYLAEYEILLNFDIDFGKIFEMRYLRSKIVDKWVYNLAQFAIENPELDPISLQDFRAIQIMSSMSRDNQ